MCPSDSRVKEPTVAKARQRRAFREVHDRHIRALLLPARRRARQHPHREENRMIEQGTVALVTGGGRGIGRAAAIALANAGMRVAASSRTLGDVEEVAKLIKKAGG